MKCTHNIDGFCTNADSPYRADFCPVENEDSICIYKGWNPIPCSFCRFFPPSSTDGKPCAFCPASAKEKK